ncbi:adhesion G-protein coupled receptor G4 isoform X2 [Amia ocellicauda]|uniref:adhesion G-protein coupled receptor G4 isoform X2 n=1 Tax=Amia ocellicauda TaxID=2972642 RepID=UPI0034640BE9
MLCGELHLWTVTAALRQGLPLLLLLVCCAPRGHGDFLGSYSAEFTKGCNDGWTLKETVNLPSLVNLTVCVSVKLKAPGTWTAFTYKADESKNYDLAIKGNQNGIHVWLKGKDYKFTNIMSWNIWHQICLKVNMIEKGFTLDVSGASNWTSVSNITVPGRGKLRLGCGAGLDDSDSKKLELYLFRLWRDTGNHSACEDGNAVGWNSDYWDFQNKTLVYDTSLSCSLPTSVSQTAPIGHNRVKREESSTTTVTASTSQPVTVNTTAGLNVTTTPPVNQTAVSPFTGSNSTASAANTPTTQGPTNTTGSNSTTSAANTSTTQGPTNTTGLNVTTTHPVNQTAVSPFNVSNSTSNAANTSTTQEPTNTTGLNVTTTHPVNQTAVSPFNVSNSTSNAANTSTTQEPTNTTGLNVTTTHPVNQTAVSPFNVSNSTSNAANTSTTQEPTNTTGLNVTTTHPVNQTAVSPFNVSNSTSNAANTSTTQEPTNTTGLNVTTTHPVNQTAVSPFNVSNSTSNAANTSTTQEPTNTTGLNVTTTHPVNQTAVSPFNVSNSTSNAANTSTTQEPTNTTGLNVTTTHPVNQTAVSPFNVSNSTSNAANTSTTQEPTNTTGLNVTTTHPVNQTAVSPFNVSNSTSNAANTSTTQEPTNTTGLNAMTTHPLNQTAVSPFNVLNSTTSNAAYPSTTQGPTNTTGFLPSTTQEKPGCNLTGFCNSTGVYYRVEIQVNDTTLSPEEIQELVIQPGPVCHTSNGTRLVRCDIVLKLNKTWDLCFITSNITSGSPVSQIAIRSWQLTNVSELPPVLSFLHNYAQMCDRETLYTLSCDREISALNCTVLTNHTSSFNYTMSSTTSHPPSANTTTTTNATTTAVDGALSDVNNLLKNTSNVSSLNAAEIESLVNKLVALVNHTPNISQDLGHVVVDVVSNLLNASAENLASSSSKLMGVVDSVGLKLFLDPSTDFTTLNSTSLALAVQRVNSSNFKEISFSIADPTNLQVSVTGQATTRVRRDGEGDVRSSTTAASITLPASLMSSLSSEEHKLASRVQFQFFQKSTLFGGDSNSLNSYVLGTSVANLSLSGLRDNVTFTLRNLKPPTENDSVKCMFWDLTKNGGKGGWNEKGCTVANWTAEETICSCNHLTSFGVLLNLQEQVESDPNNVLILTFISFIGCGISAIFLSITLMTYIIFEKLRKDYPSKILMHLCTALLLLNMVFLLDSWLALYSNAIGLCISVAFFLHYFLLVSFTWMGLEAFHMYLALVKVFNTYTRKYILKLSLVGWGAPLIVVIIVIAVNKNFYGLGHYGKFPNGATDDFCWIQKETVFYGSVVVYFCLVFLLNLSMFITVMVQLCRIKRQSPHSSRQHSTTTSSLRSAVSLTFLLGLTWGFAFFAWGPVNLPFMYLFAIFNTLQGFFIFIFHCALKENVRKEWRAHLCCGKLRTAENEDWSQTALQKTRKQPVTGGASFHSSDSTNSTSFLVSDSSGPSNEFGNPYENIAIAPLTDPNFDVLLNEVFNNRAMQKKEH